MAGKTENSLEICAGYVRVSTHEQDEYSPESQIKLLREYAKANNMLLPDEFIFRDDGISGRSAAKRPEFMRMIATAKQKPAPFSKILVWKYSRFSRNQEESIVYKSLLQKECGVTVISISEPLAEGPFGSLIERIIEWMDAFYSIRLSGEVKRGMTEKATRGEPLAAPAFGYRIQDKEYKIDADTAPIVQMIFQDFIEGMGYRDLAQKLNAMGIKTKRGGRWENRTIEYVLRNPVYIGKIRWNPSGKTRRNYSDENIMVVDGSHEPIISLEVWDEAQRKVEKLKNMYGRYARQTYPNFMLQGLVRCSNCGATLCRSVSGKSLQCQAYAKGKCDVSHSITIDKITTMFLASLQLQFESSELNLIHKSSETSSNRNKLVRTQIQREKTKLERVREAYENGVDTLEEYRQNKEMIHQRIQTLENQLIEEKPEKDIKKEFIRRNTKVVKEILRDDLSESAKNALLRTFVDKVIFYRDTESISIFFYY